MIRRILAALRRWWHRNIVADDEMSAIYDRIDRELDAKGQ